METKNMTDYKYRHATSGRTAAVMVAIVGALALLAASRAEAVIAIIKTKTTGLFGIAQGQIASAHVVNTGEVRGFIVDWRVLDSEGRILAQSEGQFLAFGQASSFDFGPLDRTGAQRMTIRVVLTVEGSSNKPGFIATQEVFDTDTGKTTFIAGFEDCACGAQ
jgi:hypothetical protein